MPASLVLGQTPAGLRQLPPSQPLHFACAAGQQRWLPCSVFTATSSGEGQQLQRSVGSCCSVKIVQLCGLQTPRVRPEHRLVWPYRLLWLSPLSLPRLSCKSLPSPGRHNKRGAAGGVPHRHRRPLIGAPVSGGLFVVVVYRQRHSWQGTQQPHAVQRRENTALLQAKVKSQRLSPCPCPCHALYFLPVVLIAVHLGLGAVLGPGGVARAATATPPPRTPPALDDQPRVHLVACRVVSAGRGGVEDQASKQCKWARGQGCRHMQRRMHCISGSSNFKLWWCSSG